MSIQIHLLRNYCRANRGGRPSGLISALHHQGDPVLRSARAEGRGPSHSTPRLPVLPLLGVAGDKAPGRALLPSWYWPTFNCPGCSYSHYSPGSSSHGVRVLRTANLLCRCVHSERPHGKNRRPPRPSGASLEGAPFRFPSLFHSRKGGQE